MIESTSEDVNVKVRTIRPARGGGVVVETASDRLRKALSRCAGLVEAGLRAVEPKVMDPRVIVYSVPNEMTNEHLLRGMYEKSLREHVSVNEFTKRVKIVRREDGQRLGNVIVELPLPWRDRLLQDGRVFVGWNSFRCCSYERVMCCFRCQGYDHRARECKSEPLCYKCGKSGHRMNECKAAEDCSNCRARKLPSEHLARSPRCPMYAWKLRLLRSRFVNNG